MKYLAKTASIAAFLLAALVTLAQPANARAADGKIRVLLTFGGHGFEEEPFFAMFDGMKDIEYTKAPMPKSAELLKPGLEKDYDVVVMYDMVAGISPDQQKAFVALLNQGIGLISLHHNMGAHRNWGEFRRITGGKYIFVEGEIEGKNYPLSDYAHDQDMKVTVADTEHPITNGVKDFEIHDEAYLNYYTDPDAKVLLTTDHPKNDPELAWVKKYGKSRVFYLMLGHDGKAYANAGFVRILHQGIRWVAEK